LKRNILYILILLTTSACKKSNSTYKPPATTPTATPVDSVYYILLSTSKAQTVSSGSLTNTFNSAIACFSNSPTGYCNPSTAVKVNSVSLNGTILKFNSSSYSDTTGYITLPPITWAVNGANGIPSFTYTNSNPLAAYTGYNSLPDTIFRNQNITINMTGVTNADKMSILINDGTATFATGNSNSTTSATFSVSSMAQLQASAAGTLYVILENDFIQTIGGKPAASSYTYQVTKTVVIK